MADQTQIEKNPPMGGNCGWGEDERDPIRHRLTKERISAQFNEDHQLYSEINSLVMARGEETPMEKYLRESMPYDGGWDLDYVDNLIYGGPAFVNQGSVGSCVGAGGVSAVASKAATEILVEGDAENPFGDTVMQRGSDAARCAVPCVDYSYGCGKMQRYWNGERFTRTVRQGDGSYCSAQIWAFKTTGILPCSKVKGSGYVFPQTTNIRRHAGNSDQFLNKHLEIGLKHLMGDSARVQSRDDLKRVIRDLKQPCMICSGWGFRPSHHVEGLGWVYKRSGHWAHNMTLAADVDFKGEEYIKVRNQWGPEAHRDGWHFWITADTFSSWVRSAEVQSIGELDLIAADSIPNFPV